MGKAHSGEAIYELGSHSVRNLGGRTMENKCIKKGNSKSTLNSESSVYSIELLFLYEMSNLLFLNK